MDLRRARRRARVAVVSARGRADGLRPGAARAHGPGIPEQDGPSRPGARRIGSRPMASRRELRAPARERPATTRRSFRNRLIESRLDPERDLADRVRAVRGRGGADLARAGGSRGGIAFIVGSVCDTLDGRYSRMSGKGVAVRRVPDSTLDRARGGHRPGRGRLPVLRRRGPHVHLRPTTSPSRRGARGDRLDHGLVHASAGPRPWASSARWASPTAPFRVVVLSAGPRLRGPQGHPSRPSTCWPSWQSSRASSSASSARAPS